MKPLLSPGRLVGLDVARCLALVGMMAVHALVPVTENGVTVVQQLAGGRSSALFAVLAGVSLVLITRNTVSSSRQERNAVAGGLVVRSLLIGGIGLIVGGFNSGIAVILTYYGVLFLLAIPFLRLGARSLAALSVAWMLFAPVLSHVVRPYLPDPTYASPHPSMIAAPWQLLTELTFTGYYPAVPWMAYLFAGMAIGRLDLSRRRAAASLLVPGVLLAAAGWFLSDALLDRPGVRRTLAETYDGPKDADPLSELLTFGLTGTTPTGSWEWLLVRAPHSGTPFDLAHTTGSALIVISLSVLISGLAPRVAAVVFGAGAMPLTLYSLHVVMRIPEIWPEDNVETFLKHVTLALTLGAVFRLARARGPLEAMVGSAAEATRESLSPPPASSEGSPPSSDASRLN